MFDSTAIQKTVMIKSSLCITVLLQYIPKIKLRLTLWVPNYNQKKIFIKLLLSKLLIQLLLNYQFKYQQFVVGIFLHNHLFPD
jgi:hypothetical protein